jgi:hypothetical protein
MRLPWLGLLQLTSVVLSLCSKCLILSYHKLCIIYRAFILESYVLLTVQFGIILVNGQLGAQFFFLYVYFNSLHVSSYLVLIIRRINFINTRSGMCHSDRLVCRSGRKFLPDLRTRRSPAQSDTYQLLYWPNRFSWWRARSCSKHVENWNKHIEKRIVRQFGHLQELLF